ncbi:putative alpha-mannosidase I MNS4 [Hibiscus syriacus]|uniref:Alpha-mannosidase I MNS4 n=1 Tax=Hibiscus syriacus TaxID=106335 RepID=A0A6A3ALK7_HIBSY|nr:putative alpha-mannosidase I MNS4 [Hibiscus syriacus]
MFSSFGKYVTTPSSYYDSFPSPGKWKVTRPRATDNLKCVSDNSNNELLRKDLHNSSLILVVLLVVCCSFIVVGGFLFFKFRYLDVGRDIIASLQYGARCPCGYCHISDVENHEREDHMESFFLAETVGEICGSFLTWLYIFSTEGHLLPATPQISLLQEHCSYFGAYCNRGYLKEEFRASDKFADSQEPNGSRVSEGWVRTAFPLDSSSLEASPVSGLIKGLCPGLTHAQKYGISYLASVDTPNEDSSAKQKETVVQSHAIVVVSDQIANQSLSGDSYNVKESTGKEPESDPSQS